MEIKHLTTSEQQFISTALGLDGSKVKTLIELSDIYGLTREEARQKRDLILNKIKQGLDFKQECKGIPKYLKGHNPGGFIDISTILNDSTLYYPGAGIDNHPIRVFESLGIINTYIYVDYLLPKDYIVKSLNDNFIEGYHLYDVQDVTFKEFKINKYVHHYKLTDEDLKRMPSKSELQSYVMVAIFESDDLKRRFSLIYLGADAFATYDILFQNYKIPTAIVIQDHGFGCNYNSFGGEGALFEIASKLKAFPKYMLRSTNTVCWKDYYQPLVYSEFLPQTHSNRDLEILK